MNALIKFALFFLLFQTVASCQKEPAHFYGYQMTMSWQVKIAQHLTLSQKNEVEKIIENTFCFVNRTFNNWNPYSEISQINQMEAGKKVLLSDSLAEFLHKVDHLVKLTEGKFDPTVEPLQRVYKYYFAKSQFPKMEELHELEPAVGWDKVHIEGNIFWKDHDKTAMDFSGVAKGYTVDLIIDRLQQLGYENVFVEWGGEVKTMGQYNKKRKWKIALENQDILFLNGAIATSGSRYQKWLVDENIYTHIIDPIQKKPLILSPNSILSVSVLGDQCYICDAIATCLMLFSEKKEAEDWAKNKKISCLISD